MPLKLRVDTELDGRSLQDAQTQAESFFDIVGRGAGAQFVSGLNSGMMAAGGGGRMFSGIASAATSMGSEVAAGAAVAAAGLVAIGVVAVEAGERLYGVGERFDAITDSIAVRTGALGANLDALATSFSNVAGNTAASLEEIGDVLGRVSASLHLTGAPLEQVTKQIADLNEMTGDTVNIRSLGMALSGFGEDAGQASNDLDELYYASSRTGIPLNDLVSIMVNAGPAARTLGLDFEDTAALITNFERAGIPAERTTMALARAANTFADSDIDLKTGLSDTITQIRGFIDAGNDAAAVDLAGRVFGTRGAQQFVDAIRQGEISADDLHASLGNTGNDIENMRDKTADWAETWQLIKNRASEAAHAIGGPLFDAVNKVLQSLLTPPGQWPQGPSGPMPPGYAPTNPLDVFGSGAAPPGRPGSPGVQGPVPGGWGPAPGMPYLDVFGLPTMGGPAAPPRTPQDINQALEDARAGGGAGGGGGRVLPYPADYGGPAMPGETPEHYEARQNTIHAQWQLANDQARLDQMEADNNDAQADNNHTEDELNAQRNKIIDDGRAINRAQQQLNNAERQRLDTVQVPYPTGYGAPARPGETAEQYGKEQAYYEAVHKRQQAEAELAQLQSSGSATQNDLIKAQNDLIKARGDEQSAILRLNESTTTAGKQLDDIGVKLDQDLGLSRGLPGLAENLTRFLAGLAAAPVLGALAGVREGMGGVPEGAGGLIGMGAVSGAFGPQFMPQAQPGGTTTMPSYPTSLGSMTTPAQVAAGGSRVAALYAVANALEGTPYSQALRNDCSGMVAQLAAAAVGLPPLEAGERFNTTNEAQWLSSHGFRMGVGPPGSLRIGWNPAPGNAGHTAATLPFGENAESGGSGGGFRVGPGAAGFDSPQFTMHAWLPMLPVNAPPQTPVPVGYAGGGAVPLIAHAGEHVLTADDVAAMGGQGNVYAFRQTLHDNTWTRPWQLPLGTSTGQYVPRANPLIAMGGWTPQFGDAPIFAAQDGGAVPPWQQPAPPPPPMPNLATGQGTGPLPGPGVGGAAGTQIGGVGWPAGPQGGSAAGGGGLLGAAASAAASAIPGGGPAAAIAAQIAIAEISRAIKFGGQLAGIGVQGLMETFLPVGASQLAASNWLVRIGGGLAGMAPQLPNLAGDKDVTQTGAAPPPLRTEHLGTGAPPGPVNITVNNQRPTEDGTGRDIAWHMQTQYAPPGIP